MTKEELKQEAEKWLNKWELCNKCENKVDCISNFSYCKKVVLQAYLASAEPREKRIAELEEKLEQTEKDLADYQFNYPTIKELQKENAELKSIAEFQQSSNMSRHFENKKLKEGLAVGSMWNKHLNSQNKALEEERDKYRDMTFEQREQLTKAKEYIKLLLMNCVGVYESTGKTIAEIQAEAEQFLKDSEVEK